MTSIRTFHEYWDTLLAWSLGATALVLVAAYLFLINRAVVATVERAQAETKLAATVSELAGLESQSLALEVGITQETAATHGFVPASQFTFLTLQ